MPEPTTSSDISTPRSDKINKELTRLINLLRKGYHISDNTLLRSLLCIQSDIESIEKELYSVLNKSNNNESKQSNLSDFQERLNSFLLSEKTLHTAKTDYANKLKSLQEICPHEKVSEKPFEAETYIRNATPPKRICEDCGLTESSFHFQILKCERVRQVTPEKFYTLLK